MLHHIGESEAADKLQAAIEKTYTERKTLTRDVGGSAGTRAFADAVIQAVETSRESATIT
jgi:isocitrate dehydrogenase (NAD+)